MKSITVRNVTIGNGRPKICVPIVNKDQEGILAEAASFAGLPVDIVEWRADWYEDVEDTKEVLETARLLRETLGETPILFTFRSLKEGGARAITPEAYEALNIAMAESGWIDLLDVEMFSGDELVTRIIEAAHKKQVRVVGSNHDFHRTPEKDEILKRLCRMQELGADIPKIAVMPLTRWDVLKLLEATLEMEEQYADRPIVTMSMAGTGVVSRLAGEIFGSSMTFGSATNVSAPGQVDVCELAQTLDVIHKSLG